MNIEEQLEDADFQEKVYNILHSLVLQEWVNAEVQLSDRYERLAKAYRGKIKNKVPLPSHPSTAYEPD